MRRLTLTLLCLIVLLPPLVRAEEIIFGAASDSPSVRNFAAALGSLRPADQVEFRPLEHLRKRPVSGDAILIALDTPTLAWRLEQPHGPRTLAMRVSRVEAHALIGSRMPAGVTLLWSDPPAERQLRLVRLLMPGARNVGLLFDEQSEFLLDEYRTAAQGLDLDLRISTWSPSGPRKPLLSLLDKTDLLLGIDAPRLYNADTIKSLLLTSYAQNRPLFGPTASFVRAGSLASTYSDQQDWLNELGDWLERPASQWPASAYPTHFKVLSNRQVARALGFAPPADSELTRLLSEGEKP